MGDLKTLKNSETEVASSYSKPFNFMGNKIINMKYPCIVRCGALK